MRTKFHLLRWSYSKKLIKFSHWQGIIHKRGTNEANLTTEDSKKISFNACNSSQWANFFKGFFNNGSRNNIFFHYLDSERIATIEGCENQGWYFLKASVINHILNIKVKFMNIDNNNKKNQKQKPHRSYFQVICKHTKM